MMTNTQVHLDHLTLDSVKQAFNDWRNKPEREKAIPLDLWQQVVQLIPHYKQRHILKTLRLNHAQLHRHLDSLTQPSSDTHSVKQPASVAPPPTPTKAFVKAFLPTADQTYQVEWQRPDGAQLIIKNLDSIGLSTLIQHWRG